MVLWFFSCKFYSIYLQYSAFDPIFHSIPFNSIYTTTGHGTANRAFSAPKVSPSLNRISGGIHSIPSPSPFHSTPFLASPLRFESSRAITGTMVRAFSKFPKKPANWVPPSAPLAERKQVFLYVYLPRRQYSMEYAIQKLT